MSTLILALHGALAVCIIAVILVQQGKGADVGSSFGGGASQTIFGAPGSGTALSRATAILTALFFVTSFALAMYTGRESDSEVRVNVPPSMQQSELQEDGAPAEGEEGEELEEEYPEPFSE